MATTVIHGIEVADVRSLFPDMPRAKIAYTHAPQAIIGISVHHDGEMMFPGDTNYNGSTMDEDIARLKAIYNWNYSRLGGFPYHLIASPNGRLFLCRNFDTWGAHTEGMNDRLLGFALMGNYSNSEPPVRELCAASLALIALWRWCDGLRLVKGHCDWPDQWTQCPGTMRSVWIDKMLRFAEWHVAQGI